MQTWTRREMFAAPAALLLEAERRDARIERVSGTRTEFALRSWETKAAWEKQRTLLKRQILLAAGMWPEAARGKLNARRSEARRHAGFSTERVWVETLPGMWVAANLYLPARVTGKAPGVLIAHGHWKLGRLEDSDECSNPQLGANLALQGYVALAYDMMGYNETNQIEHRFGRSEEERMWSFGPLGVQLFNSTRMLDFLLTLAEVNPEKVAMTGASGGGTQTFLLAAIDDRVKVVAPVNMVSAHFQGGCDCENVPGLRWGTNNVEIASMAAPRPMLMVAATGDWTVNVPRVEYPAVKKVYELYDKGPLVETWQQEAQHNYNRASREAVYAFLAKHLSGSSERPVEKPSGLTTADLAHGAGFPMPAGAKTREQLFEDWKLRARAATRSMKQQERRDRLALVLGAEWPKGVTLERKGDAVVLVDEDRGFRIPALLHEGGKTRAVLVAHPEGAQAAMASPAAEAAKRSGATVLALDLFQTGKATASRMAPPVDGKPDSNAAHFLTFNASDDACRVQDLVTGLAYLHAQRPRALTLTGIGKAAVWTHLAKAVSPVPVSLEQDGSPATEADIVKVYYAPGVLYAGAGL